MHRRHHKAAVLQMRKSQDNENLYHSSLNPFLTKMIQPKQSRIDQFQEAGPEHNTRYHREEKVEPQPISTA
jgi:hypothetical protein